MIPYQTDATQTQIILRDVIENKTVKLGRFYNHDLSPSNK